MTTNIAAEISNSKKNHFNNLAGKLGDLKLNQTKTFLLNLPIGKHFKISEYPQKPTM